MVADGDRTAIEFKAPLPPVALPSGAWRAKAVAGATL